MCYVFGKSSSFIKKKLEKSINVKKFKNLKSLVKEIIFDTRQIKSKSESKLNILFAPACTSYDQYKNFEDRGADFSKLIINNLTKL